MVRFVKLQEKHLEMVLAWRTKADVARSMFTTVTNNIEKQRRWFERISVDASCRYWIIMCEEAPIGVLNLAQIDGVNRRCSAGYYVGEEAYRSLGAMIPAYLYNYVFKVMGFHKIYGEVMADNARVLQIHALHGYRQVGTYKDHVFKEGRFYDVVLVELLSESWLNQKRYQNEMALFE